MQREEIKETLDRFGFKLRDCGNFWQTNAIWRDGDNFTAIQIYKDTGVWKDFVNSGKPFPFKVLVKKVLRTNDQSILDNYEINEIPVSSDIFEQPERKDKIVAEKTYEPEILSDLLPHYKFYEDKGISAQTLKLYQSGYATKSSMYHRYVFPIFRYKDDKVLIGFSGRHVSWEEGSNLPKWKHLGTKKNWVYPLCLPTGGSYDFEKAVEATRSAYIIESVGDSLALTENGMLNHVVTFGLDLSQKVMMSLLSLGVREIYICTNNDSNKKENRGKIAALKYFVYLMDFFDLDVIRVKMPQGNDLSEMHENGVFNKWVDREIDWKKQKHQILQELKKDDFKYKVPKKLNLDKKIKKLEQYLGYEDF